MGKMTYTSAWYLTDEASWDAYKALEDAARDSNASVFREDLQDTSQPQAGYRVTVIGEYFSPLLRQEMARWMPKEGRVTLPSHIEKLLSQRRTEQVAQAKESPLHPGRYFGSSHGKVYLDEQGQEMYPIWRQFLQQHPQLQEDALRKLEQQMADELARHPLPFFVAYRKAQILSMYRDVKKDIVPSIQRAFLPDTIEAYNAAYNAMLYIHMVYDGTLVASQKYLFTSSALAMHAAVMESTAPLAHTVPAPWLVRPQYYWIGFDAPLDTPFGSIMAFHIRDGVPMKEIDALPLEKNSAEYQAVRDTYLMHQHQWDIEMLSPEKRVFFDMTYDTQAGQWAYQASHICPHKECRYDAPDYARHEMGACHPCQWCQDATAYWVQWLRVAVQMIDGVYALAPEAPQFPLVQQDYTVLEQIMVGKGKNRHHVTAQKQRHLDYILVSYDASLKPRRGMREGIPLGSWKDAHTPEEIIYELRHIPAMERTYRAPHFQPLIAAVSAGAVTHSPANGEAYTLVTAAGETLVIGRVEEHDRYVPLLNVQRQTPEIIKKVKASLYG